MNQTKKTLQKSNKKKDALLRECRKLISEQQGFIDEILNQNNNLLEQNKTLVLQNDTLVKAYTDTLHAVEALQEGDENKCLELIQRVRPLIGEMFVGDVKSDEKKDEQA